MSICVGRRDVSRPRRIILCASMNDARIRAVSDIFFLINVFPLLRKNFYVHMRMRSITRNRNDLRFPVKSVSTM